MESANPDPFIVIWRTPFLSNHLTDFHECLLHSYPPGLYASVSVCLSVSLSVFLGPFILQNTH